MAALQYAAGRNGPFVPVDRLLSASAAHQSELHQRGVLIQ
jgi:hypothetical protein